MCPKPSALSRECETENCMGSRGFFFLSRATLDPRLLLYTLACYSTPRFVDPLVRRSIRLSVIFFYFLGGILVFGQMIK